MISDPRDYFHSSSTAYCCTHIVVLTYYTKVRIYILFSVVERFQSFFVFSSNNFHFARDFFPTYGKKHISDFLEWERH